MVQCGRWPDDAVSGLRGEPAKTQAGRRRVRLRGHAALEQRLAGREDEEFFLSVVTARTHAQLWAELASTGKLIGPHNLWIAAACVAHGLTLVTGNQREFKRAPGLAIESWLSKTRVE